MVRSQGRTFWRAFGPGVLFAGAAVGVSHLVQSTRAGADYGFALILLVVVANLAKYPAFRFGPQYAAATGTSLLEGYRRQGRWALVVYGLLTVGTMFAVQAAVTVVTAGLFKALVHVDASVVWLSTGLWLVCALILGVGRFQWLDRVTKVLVAVLTVCTLVATVLVLPRVSWSSIALVPDASMLDAKSLMFMAALVGWMPSAIDVAVWQSLWTLARRRDTGHRPSLKESLLDFHIGYWGTAVLALCFVTLGAAIMHNKGIAVADQAGAFAAQVIALYTETLGSWSRVLIGASAFAVMFSTTLTVVDGFPRALSVLFARFDGPELEGGVDEDHRANARVYWISMAVLGVGALAILRQFLHSLTSMVDFATTLSFLTAPVLAWLNHRAILSDEVPVEARPKAGIRIASWLGIGFLTVFAGYYLYVRFS